MIPGENLKIYRTHLVDFLPFFLSFLPQQSPSEKGVYSKWNEFAPHRRKFEIVQSLTILIWKSKIWRILLAEQQPLFSRFTLIPSRPRWLSWMRRPTGDQEVAGSTPAEVGNIPSWRLIMKYFLRSFSPFRWFKKGSCQFLAKECAQYWLTA